MSAKQDSEFAVRLAIGFGMIHVGDSDEQQVQYEGLSADEYGVWEDERLEEKWWESVEEEERLA